MKQIIISLFVASFLLLGSGTWMFLQPKPTTNSEVQGVSWIKPSTTKQQNPTQAPAIEESGSQQNVDKPQISSPDIAPTNTPTTDAPQKPEIKTNTFTGEKFNKLYEEMVYTKVTSTKVAHAITNNQKADKIITQIALDRGYKLRPEAVSKNLVTVVNNQKLQTEARDAYLKLQANAKKDNLNLVLVSGYRSTADQKNIFLGELKSNKLTADQIAKNQGSQTLDKIMQTRSTPGFSRHHTGYTVDIGCNSTNLLDFKTTKCFEWISKNDYEQARKVGLIPSYPDGVNKQGPNPEEWEYVWVGLDKLKT